VKISGLHLLLTFECNLQCDHCFVWGSPSQSGTMTLKQIREILNQAKEAGTIDWVYFEGGEPFLYYGALINGVKMAAGHGFQVGIVSNGYWATDMDDAVTCLQPFAGLVQDLSISSDAYHWSEKLHQQTLNAVAAAQKLAIPVGVISIAQPEAANADSATGQIPAGQSAVVFRGRAVEQLAARADQQSWEQYRECPFEDLREPERVHLDALGNVHICQGISLGNVFDQSLSEIFENYEPDTHPITGPLLSGGPADLVRRYGLSCNQDYSDACHLCCEARGALRTRFPKVLTPDQMYGVFNFQ
jgi:MoaA/NifB/PqqE/SkfB family radical SAM enzyme